MATSDKLELNLLVAGQANPDITVNRYLYALEALTGGSIAVQAAPPASSPGPSNGDVYRVATGSPAASGAWLTKEDDIAVYQDGWIFLSPYEGLLLYNQADLKEYRFTSSTWSEVASAAGSASVEITNGANSLTAGAPVIHDGTELDQVAPGTSDTAERFIGIINEAVSASATATIYVAGEIEYVSWTWTVGSPIYWTGATTLSQTAPSTGIYMKVGVATAATKMVLHLGSIVNLG